MSKHSEEGIWRFYRNIFVVTGESVEYEPASPVPRQKLQEKTTVFSRYENCILPCQGDMKDVQQNLLLHGTQDPFRSTCGSHKRKTTASIYLQLATSPRRLRSQDLHGSARSSTAVKTRTMNRVSISSRRNLTTVVSLPWSMGTIPVASHTNGTRHVVFQKSFGSEQNS